MSSKPVIPLKPINFAATARAVEEFAASNNIPSLTFPRPANPQAGGGMREGDAAAPQSAAAAATPIKSRTMKRLPMEVPEYVIDALKQRAAENKGASVRYVVLCALKAYGIDIDDDELVKDKRRDG